MVRYLMVIMLRMRNAVKGEKYNIQYPDFCYSFPKKWHLIYILSNPYWLATLGEMGDGCICQELAGGFMNWKGIFLCKHEKVLILSMNVNCEN